MSEEKKELLNDSPIKDNNSDFSSNNSICSDNSVADEIRKYHKLYEDGVISEEEFNKKKESLLSKKDNKNEFNVTQAIKSIDLKKMPKAVIVAIVSVVIVIGFVIIRMNSLSRGEKAVVDMVNAHINEFKDPASIRVESAHWYSMFEDVTSGFGSDDIGVAWVTLSGKNSYGERVTGCYYFGGLSDMISSDACNDFEDNVDVNKINRKLKP